MELILDSLSMLEEKFLPQKPDNFIRPPAIMHNLEENRTEFVDVPCDDARLGKILNMQIELMNKIRYQSIFDFSNRMIRIINSNKLELSLVWDFDLSII
uniref:Uncharacterized protein n=1 Tax=Meloidogyne enterolobii TaxID=390850 RepID=A0A6V7U9R8_MELEN|nr:unnamed protein product [Meloidogyne enterolobii]